MTHIIAGVVEIAWEIQRITGGQPVFTVEEKTSSSMYSSSVISFDLMCIKCYVGRIKEMLPVFATTCQALAQYVCL